MCTRLVPHKGIDLVRAKLGEFLNSCNAQVALLGTGDWQYEDFFRRMAAWYPGRVGVKLDFIPALSRRLYAGSDLFLMPSKTEPCGLSQMIALRYGSVPVVRATGGLKDSVTDSGDGDGCGFTFDEYTGDALLHALRRAIGGYADEAGWNILRRRAMECDFSWTRSAGDYIRRYKQLTQ
jgi:starch synthase